MSIPLPALAGLLALGLTTATVQPRLLGSVPALTTADPRLEEALRTELFPVQVEDDQGHGPDPGSSEWRLARSRLMRRDCEAAGPLRYAYNRVDLNGDRQDELVATVLGPYTCGTGGCSFFVFQESGGRLRTLTRMTLFRPPLIVASSRTKGWNDLILRVRRDAGHGDTMLLRFDGRSYPSNPSSPPAVPLSRSLTGTAYLVLGDGPDAGLPLPCAPCARCPA